jgi:hypothetical protein
VVLERQPPVRDAEVVRDELLARPLVAGDDARDRRTAVVAIADPDGDVVADP